jgi:hypothetical protein
MPGRTRWGEDDWSFGELVRYRSPGGSRSTLAIFVSVQNDGRAIIVTQDRGRTQSVSLDCLKRDPQLQPKLRAQLRVTESDDPVMGIYALEIRFRRHWKQLAIVFNEADFRVIRSPVITALQAAGVEVTKIDTPWD